MTGGSPSALHLSRSYSIASISPHKMPPSAVCLALNHTQLPESSTFCLNCYLYLIHSLRLVNILCFQPHQELPEDKEIRLCVLFHSPYYKRSGLPSVLAQ